jgi:hypothetical protein
MSFADGGFPNESIVSQWLALCRSVYKGEGKGEVCIGVHCVAGLGRYDFLSEVSHSQTPIIELCEKLATFELLCA